MFFKLLKLAGIDVNAKIAELRADLELKAQGISELAAVKARNLALIASLFVGASIFLLLALIVGLVALFHWGELHYGPYIGIALDRLGPVDPCRAMCGDYGLNYALKFG